MRKSAKILSQKNRFRSGVQPRRGVYVLELILILPVILLVLVLLYQVSIMMTTWQTLRTTALNAVITYSQADSAGTGGIPQQVENAIQESIRNYYFGNCAILRAENSAGWATSGSVCRIRYRLLYRSKDAAENAPWSYYDPASSTLAAGDFLAVELKLENADDAFPGYWLLARFTGVNAVQSESMVLSQFSARVR